MATWSPEGLCIRNNSTLCNWKWETDHQKWAKFWPSLVGRKSCFHRDHYAGCAVTVLLRGIDSVMLHRASPREGCSHHLRFHIATNFGLMESLYGNGFRPKEGYGGNIDNLFCFSHWGAWHRENHISYYWSPPGSIIAGQQVTGYCWSQVTTALSPTHSVMVPVTRACSNTNGCWTHLLQVGTDGNMVPLTAGPQRKGLGCPCNMLGHFISWVIYLFIFAFVVLDK